MYSDDRNDRSSVVDCALMLACGICVGVFATLAWALHTLHPNGEQTTAVVLAVIAVLGAGSAISYIRANAKE